MARFASRYVARRLAADARGWAVLDTLENEAVRHLSEAEASALAKVLGNNSPSLRASQAWEALAGWATHPCSARRACEEAGAEFCGCDLAAGGLGLLPREPVPA